MLPIALFSDITACPRIIDLDPEVARCLGCVDDDRSESSVMMNHGKYSWLTTQGYPVAQDLGHDDAWGWGTLGGMLRWTRVRIGDRYPAPRPSKKMAIVHHGEAK